MAQIGYDLYCKLVKREMSEAMGKPVIEDIECSVDMGFDAYIPSDYISDEMLKIDMYRRVSAVNSLEKAKNVRTEFIDRFGNPPQEVENLLWGGAYKRFCKKSIYFERYKKARDNRA